MRILKTIQKYKRRLAIIFFAFLFITLYIPFLPAAKAVYALESVQQAEDAVVYMYGQIATDKTVSTGSYYRMQMKAKDIKGTKEILEPQFITVRYTGSAKKLLSELNLSDYTLMDISGGTLYTGYSAKVYGRDLAIGAKRVNVQVYIKGDNITVGCPTIYDSY